MKPSITRYGNDKKSCASQVPPISPPPPEQFYQPGDCEEAGWPDVTHIVASSFEAPGSPLGPGMGWLNRFFVFTAGLPPTAHFNLFHNKRWTEKLEFSKQWLDFFIKWLNWVAGGTLVVHIYSIENWTLQQEWRFIRAKSSLFCAGCVRKPDNGIVVYLSDFFKLLITVTRTRWA